MQNLIIIDTAELFFAPVGGVLANQETVSPGVTVKFDAVIAGDLIHVYANVSLTTLSVDASGGSQAPGAQVIDYPWDGGANQKWWIQPTGNGYAEIVNVNSGQCLTVPGGDYNAGDSIEQWPCTGQAEEQWSMQITQQNLLGPTAYLVNELNGYVVDAAGASWFSANLDQWYNNGGWNQQWTQSPGIL